MAVKSYDIDEAEYNNLVALRGVASKMVAKPESRRLLEQAQKLVDPNAPTPLLDQEAAQLAPVQAMEKKFNDELAAMKKERDDEKREITLKAIADRQTAGIARLRQQGWLDEGIAKVQKLMDDKGLLEVEDAVSIFQRDNPPPTPATPQGGITGSSWGFVDPNSEADKSIQELIASKGQNEFVADKMANAALNDFRASRR